MKLEESSLSEYWQQELVRRHAEEQSNPGAKDLLADLSEELNSINGTEDKEE